MTTFPPTPCPPRFTSRRLTRPRRYSPVRHGRSTERRGAVDRDHERARQPYADLPLHRCRRQRRGRAHGHVRRHATDQTPPTPPSRRSRTHGRRRMSRSACRLDSGEPEGVSTFCGVEARTSSPHGTDHRHRRRFVDIRLLLRRRHRQPRVSPDGARAQDKTPPSTTYNASLAGYTHRDRSV